MKNILASLSLVLCLSAVILYPAAAVPVACDINQSGTVDAVDVQIVINAALGLETDLPTDVDYNGFTNAVDVQLVINAALGIIVDIDNDGLCDAAEPNLLTNPNLFDTDGDGVGDGQEILDGTDPLVADGGDIITVPDLVGQSESEVVQTIADVGLTVGTITYQNSDTVDKGDVISQTPAAGQDISSVTPIDLVVSLGPELSVVPGEMVSVPASSFEMGDPWDEGESNERPVHTVTLSAYEIGKYEVTNGEYADILNWAVDTARLDYTSGDVSAYGQMILQITSDFCQISYSNGEFVVKSRDGYSMANHPVVMVTWFGAAVYCNWLSEKNGIESCYDTTTWECDFSKNGYHLPTEAQWERAAAWDADSNRHYRFGNGSDSISRETANYYDGYDYSNPLGLTSMPYTSPVGYYANNASPVGCYDMAGNAWEWCNDRWFRQYTSEPVTDPVGPDQGTIRIGRGNSWYGNTYGARTSFRSLATQSVTDYATGFRIAK